MTLKNELKRFIMLAYDMECFSNMLAIDRPDAGFTRYLMQFKENEPYMGEDMRKNIVFINPYNEPVSLIFPSDEKERRKIASIWVKKIREKDSRHTKKNEFVMFLIEPRKNLSTAAWKNLQYMIDNPSAALAEAWYEVVRDMLQGTGYDCVCGVWHGEQWENHNGTRIRTPHVHVLARKMKRGFNPEWK